MYAIGSKVVHPALGAGQIVRIIERTIGAHSASYYEIDMTSSPHPTQVMVAVGRADDMGLRHVGQVEGLRATLGGCADAPVESEINRDFRKRQLITGAHLKSGIFQEITDAVRVLYFMDKQRPLGMTEKDALRQGKDMLAGELALASDQDMAQALGEVEDLLACMLPVPLRAMPGGLPGIAVAAAGDLTSQATL